MGLEQILTPENAALLSQFLGAVLLGVLSIVVASVSTYLRKLFKAVLTEKQQSVLGNLSAQAVLAAEQMGAAGYIEDKKAQALLVVSQTLESAGIKVTPQQIEAAIEAAVLVEINQPKLDAVVGTEAQVIAAEAAAEFEEKEVERKDVFEGVPV